MEICGGQTHAIMRHGIDQLLPSELTLVHGPGVITSYSIHYTKLYEVLKHVTFEELKSGEFELNGQQVKAVPLTSYTRSLEIANELKSWIEKGEFLLSEPQEPIRSE